MTNKDNIERDKKTRNSHRKNRKKQKNETIIPKTHQTPINTNYQTYQDIIRHTSKRDKPRTNSHKTTTTRPASHFKHGTGKIHRSKQAVMKDEDKISTSQEIRTHQDEINTLEENKRKFIKTTSIRPTS